MKNAVIYISVILIFQSIVTNASDYYVSDNGNDNGSGTISEPFKTIQKGVSVLHAGDRLFIREGRYHETVDIYGLEGTPENPIVISPYQNEKVILDGTVSIEDISSDTWHLYKDNIYKIQLDQAIWQLMVDEQVQTSARWPNAFWHDGSIFNQNYWVCGGDKDSINFTEHYGRLSSNPIEPYLDLAASGVNVSGAMAILNIANYDTYCEKVLSHSAGENSFTFTYNEYNTCSHSPKKNSDGTLVQIYNKYFFECVLDLLDAPTEWFYDKDTKILYYYPDDGQIPSGRDIRGKDQTYFFMISNSSNIQIKGFDFFGTTFSFMGCQSMLVENCNLLYPSYSKRMLGEIYAPDCTRIWTYDTRKISYEESNCTVRNCTFVCADGDGISLQGTGNVIDNCLFSQIDYSCVDVCCGGVQDLRIGNGGTIQAWHSPGVTIRRVTVDVAGEADGICGGVYNENYPNAKNLIEYCHIMKSGLLHIQDGANFHLWQFNSDYTTLRYNWAHDSYKYGYRYDGDYMADGSRVDYCTMHHCVSWDRIKENVLDAKGYHTREGNGMMIRGDWHQTYNNLAMDSQSASIYIRSEDDGNQHSVTKNNAGESISGIRLGSALFNGDQAFNYSADDEEAGLKDLLRDPDNWDFRPQDDTELVDAGVSVSEINDNYVGDAPDIGAYEYGDTDYWIPGYQFPNASTPIPLNNGTTNVELVDLMWLSGYKSVSNDVFFGESPSEVKNADKGSFLFKGNQTDNIFNPGQLEAGKTYYWRVDAVGAESTIKGEVWSFTCAKSANISDPSNADIFNKKQFKIYPNPVKDKLNIQLDANEANIKLQNMMGETIIVKKINNTINILNLERIPDGMYLFNIRINNETDCAKLMIRN